MLLSELLHITLTIPSATAELTFSAMRRYNADKPFLMILCCYIIIQTSTLYLTNL